MDYVDLISRFTSFMLSIYLLGSLNAVSAYRKVITPLRGRSGCVRYDVSFCCCCGQVPFLLFRDVELVEYRYSETSEGRGKGLGKRSI